MTEQGKHICRHIVAEPGVCARDGLMLRRTPLAALTGAVCLLSAARQEVLETPWKPDWRSPSHSTHQGQKVDNPFAGAKL